MCLFSRVTHHVGGCGEGLAEQAFDREPLDRTVLIIAEAVIILWEQISGQRVIRDLHSQVVVDTGEVTFHEFETSGRLSARTIARLHQRVVTDTFPK